MGMGEVGGMMDIQDTLYKILKEQIMKKIQGVGKTNDGSQKYILNINKTFSF